MSSSKLQVAIATPSITELSHLVSVSEAVKNPSHYLQHVCRQLAKMLHAPVSGFIATSQHNHYAPIEQILPLNVRNVIDYPNDCSWEPDQSSWRHNSAVKQVSKNMNGATPQPYPLHWRDEHLGGLIVWTDETFSEQTQILLSFLVTQISTNLKTLLLEQSSRTNLAESITLHKITQAITKSLDFNKVSASLLSQAKKFFNVDAVTLALLTPDGKELYVDQSIGLSAPYVSKLRIKRDSAFIARIIKASSSIQLNNLETSPVAGDPKMSKEEGVKSGMITPIFSNGTLVGTLGLISKSERIFTSSELRFGQSLAEHVGIAFANANLHSGLRKASNEIEQTRNLMRDGLLVFDLEHRLHYFNAAAGAVFELSPDHLMKRFATKSFKTLPGLKIDTSELELAIDKALQGHVSRTQFSVDDTELRYYEAIYSPYRDNKGVRIGALMNIRDISSLYLEKEKLQAIQNGISDGLILLDISGETIEFNEEWLRLFNVQTDLLGKHFFEELAHRQNFTCDHDLIEVVANALKGKHITCYAHDIQHGRHIQVSVNPIIIGGRVTGAVATARDITSLIEKTVEANEMAAKAHRHLRELSQLAELSGIVGFNVSNIYQRYLSKTATLLESTSVSLYLYQPAKQLLIQDQTTNAVAGDTPTLELSSKHIAARAFSTRQSVTIKSDGITPHRIALPITHHSKTLGVLIIGRTGNAYGEHEAKLLRMVATRLAVLVENANLYHDVNARRERWEAVFRFTDEGIVIFDRTGTIVGFNPACTQITQFHAAEAIGRPFAKIIRNVGPDSISGTNIGPIERVLDEGVTIAKSEQLIENRGGTRVWTEISYSPIFDDGGKVTSGIAIIRNTTKDREVEEIKSDFISIVSHELRTPLTAIKGFLSMTLKHDFGPLSEKQFHYLSRVYQSNQRMIDLVEDLMDATYIESGKITLNIAPVALDNVVNSVVSEVAAKGAAGQIMINVKRRQRLPLVLADETRLHQVVLNLVDNAIKYSMPGTEIEVSFRVQDDELITTVTDHGVGINKSQIDRLFTKFGRIFNPLSVQAGGTGLGLYIVKNLIESHDGRIWVSSQEGKGSKFNFSLPIAKQLPLIE